MKRWYDTLMGRQAILKYRKEAKAKRARQEGQEKQDKKKSK